jgi:hypothetical protein
MTDVARTPTTAAGRAVVEATASDPFVSEAQRSELRAAALRTVLAIVAEAVAVERARIRAAVEGLSTSCLVLGSSCMSDCHRVTANAVLALLDPQP